MATILTLPTYDGGGQTVHPDVLKVGDTYWMAITPYTDSNESLENPSILRSTDGLTWTVPEGLTNPVVSMPAGGHNADPDLVWDGSAFHLFYIDYIDGTNQERVLHRSSADGVTWSAADVAVTVTGHKVLSPAIVHVAGAWRMWTVDMTTTPNTLTMRTSSSPGSGWSGPTDCDLSIPADKDIWHVDVVPYRGGLVAALDYCDRNTSGDGAFLALGASHTGLDWTVGGTTIVPAGSVSRVYRGTLLRDAGAWRLWYSEWLNATNDWRTLHDTLAEGVVPDAREAVASLVGAVSAWPSMRP
jgi:hypothetical protein